VRVLLGASTESLRSVVGGHDVHTLQKHRVVITARATDHHKRSGDAIDGTACYIFGWGTGGMLSICGCHRWSHVLGKCWPAVESNLCYNSFMPQAT